MNPPRGFDREPSQEQGWRHQHQDGNKLPGTLSRRRSQRECQIYHRREQYKQVARAVDGAVTSSNCGTGGTRIHRI